MTTTKNQDKATARPLRIYESLDPNWKKFSVSFPGIQNTQWYDSREAAEFAIKQKGFSVYIEVPTIRIPEAEHAALCAVAEADKKLERVATKMLAGGFNGRMHLLHVTIGKSCEISRDTQAALAAIRKEGV